MDDIKIISFNKTNHSLTSQAIKRIESYLITKVFSHDMTGLLYRLREIYRVPCYLPKHEDFERVRDLIRKHVIFFIYSVLTRPRALFRNGKGPSYYADQEKDRYKCCQIIFFMVRQKMLSKSDLRELLRTLQDVITYSSDSFSLSDWLVAESKFVSALPEGKERREEEKNK